jgi:hypothetical protein
MDTVTYPDARVAGEINAYFVPAHFNTVDPAPDKVKHLAREFRQVWTPTFVFLDPHRIEVRRTVGYLPPDEFIPELGMARGAAAIVHAEYPQAFDLFRSVATQWPHAAVAPEALYWAGVSAYRRDGKADGLRQQWNELHERYPNSTWWTRASFITG